MPPDERDPAWTDDAILNGRLRLLQPRRGHRFGHDAILLAAATAARSGDHAVELGAGVGAAGLALAWRIPGLRLTMVDIDPGLAAAAQANAERNGLADRAKAVALDVAAPAECFAAAGLAPGVADLVLMNPPFYDPAVRPASPDPERRRAHVAERGSLASWISAAARLLRSGGALTLIYPADRLADVLASLGGEFGAVAVLPVHAKPDAPAIRVLVRAIKGSAGPLALLPALRLNDAEGCPTKETEAILRHGAALPIAAR